MNLAFLAGNALSTLQPHLSCAYERLKSHMDNPHSTMAVTFTNSINICPMNVHNAKHTGSCCCLRWRRRQSALNIAILIAEGRNQKHRKPSKFRWPNSTAWVAYWISCGTPAGDCLQVLGQAQLLRSFQRGSERPDQALVPPLWPGRPPLALSGGHLP